MLQPGNRRAVVQEAQRVVPYPHDELRSALLAQVELFVKMKRLQSSMQRKQEE